MAWVSIDDQFHDHPKAEQVGPLGRDLYVAGLEYANRNLTDGFIPKATAGRLVSFYDIPGINVTVNPYDVVQLLLVAGLWDAADGGFQIHDRELFELRWSGQGERPARQEWNAIRERLSPIVMQRFDYRCQHCGASNNLAVDHIIPIARGGTNDIENLQVLCQPCNSRKGARA